MDGKQRLVYEISKNGKVLFTAYLFTDNVNFWQSKEKREQGYTLQRA